ncbi:MAG: SMC-Scp complex subunit ScpB [Abitibacteriaceae bacterium]|nr:SMC-Scp complex subunit ScpB [Abditibacteriaceae bacterium]
MTQISKADIIEAVLFAADKPVPLKKLAQIAELELRQVTEELEVLREEKRRIGALQIVEVAGGWQMVSKPDFAPYIKQLRDVPRQRLSRAAFEVLAIVAYRQPVTRAEIENLRGVDCAGPIQFLLDKKLITLEGRKEAPGRPWLYASTPQFLDHFGLRSINDLPSLAEFAQLNDAATDPASLNLFNRPAMQVQEVTVPNPANADHNGNGTDNEPAARVAVDEAANEAADIAAE